MRYIIAGTNLVFRTPRLWRYIVQPLLVGFVAFVAVAVGSYLLIVPALNREIVGRIGDYPLISFLTSGLFVLLLVLTSGMLYLELVSFFSASLWEKLSLEVEVIATGNRIEANLPLGVIVGDSVARGLFAMAVVLASMCCGWWFFGIPTILFAGYLGLYDATSAALLRRGISFPSQGAYVRQLPSKFTFVIGAGLLALIPLLNVLMLPCLVAGGTLMVAEREASGWKFPPPADSHAGPAPR